MSVASVVVAVEGDAAVDRVVAGRGAAEKPPKEAGAADPKEAGAADPKEAGAADPKAGVAAPKAGVAAPNENGEEEVEDVIVGELMIAPISEFAINTVSRFGHACHLYLQEIILTIFLL